MVFVLALLTSLLSVLNPVLLIFVPFTFMVLALQPRRPFLLLIAVVLLWSTFSGSDRDVLWWYGRGWSLILGAWFVLAIVLFPRVGMLGRGLASVGASALTATLLLGVNRAGWYALDTSVASELRSGASEIVAFWSVQLKDKPWLADLSSAVYRFAEFQARTFPALLALASLCGLAVAWWLWRRLSAQDLRPLGALRDFRFTDELIWLVVLGAALMVLPLQSGATRAGANLLTFMAALYAVRGFAVMLALFGAPSLLGGLFGVLLFLMLYPIVMATTLMVGLTDTWLDLRSRRLKKQDDEKH
ncbi:MAG TPA: DUF2232 domain-containing protein [Longimicrobiales bacterium]